MATLLHIDNVREDIQKVSLHDTYTLDMLFDIIKVNKKYPYMYYKGMYKLDMSSNINIDLVDPVNSGRIEMYHPERVNVRIYDKEHFSLYGNTFLVMDKDIKIDQKHIVITVQDGEKRPVTFNATEDEKLGMYGLVDSEWIRHTHINMTWNGIRAISPYRFGYNYKVLVRIVVNQKTLLEYTLQDMFSNTCISIQDAKQNTTLIYDMNHYESIMNPKFIYNKPKLVFFGSTKSVLYKTLSKIEPPLIKETLTTYIKSVYDVNTKGNIINQHMWLDACLNDATFNKYIYIEDFSTINENVVNMKMKGYSDKMSFTFLPTTQQFRFNLEVSGGKIETLENDMRLALVEMLNAYIKNKDVGLYSIYTLFAEGTAKVDTDDKPWWETTQGRTGTIDKTTGNPMIYNPLDKRQPPKWYNQVYLTSEGYTGQGSGGCPTRNRPVAISKSKYDRLRDEYPNQLAVIETNSAGEMFPSSNKIYISCRECEDKSEDECEEDKACQFKDGSCSNIFSRMQGPHQPTTIDGKPNSLYREKYCCSKSAGEGGRTRRGKTTTVDDTRKSTTTISKGSRYDVPVEIVQFLKGDNYYRQQSNSIEEIKKTRLGVKASLLYSLWGNDKDVYKLLFEKMSARLGRKASIKDMYNICRQENYDLTLSQFDYVLDNKYINPRRFIRLIEFIEDANVIIFTRNGRDITIALPNYVNEYVRVSSLSAKPTIAIYEHYGSSNNEKDLRDKIGYPFCQVIRRDGVEPSYALPGIDLSVVYQQYTLVQPIDGVSTKEYRQCFDSAGKVGILQYVAEDGVFNMFLKQPIEPLSIPSVSFESCITNTTDSKPPIDERLYTTPCKDGGCGDIDSKDMFYKTQKVASIIVEIIKHKFSFCTGSGKAIMFPSLVKTLGDECPLGITDIRIGNFIENNPEYTIDYIYNNIYPNINQTMKKLKCTKKKKIKIAASNIDIIKRNIQFILEKEYASDKKTIIEYENNVFFPNYFETAFDWIRQLNANETIVTSPAMFKEWVPIQNSL